MATGLIETLPVHTTCGVRDCTKRYAAKGMCLMHYKRKKRSGTLEASKRDHHAKSYTREYRAWLYMKARCFNPRTHAYEHYGGRGITVYEPWTDNFTAFLDYIGPKPSRQHSLDRIDVDGNYEPGNVRWATKAEQMNNTRRNLSYKVVS